MPQTCPQCQTATADDAKFCPNCGTPLQGAAAAGTAATRAGTEPRTGAAASGPRTGAARSAPSARASSLPPYRFDAARWSIADRISGAATVVLFISLFLSWFGVSVVGVTVTASGLDAHGYLYIVLILCIAIVAYLVLRAGWDRMPIGQNVPHLTIMLVATVVNLVLTFFGFIFKPGGSGVGWQFGAVLGLIAAIVAAAPYAVPQLRAKTM